MHAHALPVFAHTCRFRNKTQGRTAAKARSPQVHAQKARSAKKSKMRGACFRTRCHNPDVAAPKKGLQNPKTGRRRPRQGQFAAGARSKSKMREKKQDARRMFQNLVSQSRGRGAEKRPQKRENLVSAGQKRVPGLTQRKILPHEAQEGPNGRAPTARLEGFRQGKTLAGAYFQQERKSAIALPGF